MKPMKDCKCELCEKARGNSKVKVEVLARMKGHNNPWRCCAAIACDSYEDAKEKIEARSPVLRERCEFAIRLTTIEV